MDAKETIMEYLEKKMYVYRRSYKYFQKLDILLTTTEFLCSASGLTAFVFLPLATLSLSAGIVEIVRKQLKVKEKVQEFKMITKFYYKLKSDVMNTDITDDEVKEKESEFLSHIEYFPKEKYLKQKKLNGYK